MKIKEVFTPRSSRVNEKTYIPRLLIEEALIRAVNGSMHVILFGESGNGKSWLYKKVLHQHSITYRVANCANASRMNSITDEITNAVGRGGDAIKTGYSETKEASVKALVADAKINHVSQFNLIQTDPLESAFETLRASSQSDVAVIVIDNLESIFSSATLMNELADIIILIDDERYAKYKIKFLIVGVPNGILEYFAKTKNLESVSNRLEELPKVGGLTEAMVRTLVDVGFNTLLKYHLEKSIIDKITRHIHYCTMGVAQRVQEYCEKLAFKIEDHQKKPIDELLAEVDTQWLLMGMRQAYTVVESHLNSKKTTIARRNQVIFCIGKISAHQLDSNKISEKILEEFPETVTSGTMGVGSILGELANDESPLLNKNPKTNEYRVVDPRYIMCIRLMLRKNSHGFVEKLSFRQ